MRLFGARVAAGMILWHLLPGTGWSAAAPSDTLPVVGRVRAPGSLEGRVLDAVTGAGVSGATVLLAGTERWSRAAEDGSFLLDGVPADVCSLKVVRLGYRPHMERLAAGARDSLRLLIRLDPEAVELPAVVVSGARPPAGRAASDGAAVVRLSGRRLREQLGATVARTLAGQPGLEERTMGPAPARPVLRGFSGNRLLLLEDGERMGDLSATSADHAVVFDPMGAREIQVIRGPAALLFGGNAHGGVIDVTHDAVPGERPATASGTVMLQGETVNRGGSGTVQCTLPLTGGWVTALEAGARGSGDMTTPAGTLRRTGIRTENGTLGVSRVFNRGFVGVSAGLHESDYGIPGGFLGGHPAGVGIELNRRRFEVRGAWRPERSTIHSIEAHVTETRYAHEELESGDICGVAFGVNTTNALARIRLEGDDLPGHLIVGGWAERRDFDTACLSFVPHTIETSGAGFVYGERPFSRGGVQGGLRFEARRVDPAGRDTTKAGVIRRRQYHGLSAGIGGHVDPAPGVTISAFVLRTFNAPGLEELFADGPHLAAYSYEVGNADLEAESGLVGDLVLTARGARGEASVGGFYNRLHGFIFPADTGELEYGAGEEGVLARYRYTGRDARVFGGEFSGWFAPTPRWRVEATLSSVRGEFTATRRPLPAQPPLTGRVTLRRLDETLAVAGTLRGAARQTRLDEFEQPTAGYLVLDILASRVFRFGPGIQTLVIGIDNVTNTAYRNHLSRVKSVLPEPGRNLRVLWRIGF